MQFSNNYDEETGTGQRSRKGKIQTKPRGESRDNRKRDKRDWSRERDRKRNYE